VAVEEQAHKELMIMGMVLEILVEMDLLLQ
jgi:hypothetical protein